MPTNCSWPAATIGRADREDLQGHRGGVVWFTGLSGAGKSTLATALEARLHGLGCRSFILDGDHLRHGLCSDLGFSLADRQENIRRAGELARLFVGAGVLVLCAFISPLREDRRRARSLVPEGDFVEVYCRSPLAVCERRDVKGLYRRARAGEIPDFTGIGSPYEEPERPELLLDTAAEAVDACVERVVERMRRQGMLDRARKAA